MELPLSDIQLTAFNMKKYILMISIHQTLHWVVVVKHISLVIVQINLCVHLPDMILTHAIFPWLMVQVFF